MSEKSNSESPTPDRGDGLSAASDGPSTESDGPRTAGDDQIGAGDGRPGDESAVASAGGDVAVSRSAATAASAGSDAKATAVLTKEPAAGTSAAASSSDASVPVAALLAASRTADQTDAAASRTGARPGVPAMPPPIPPVPKRWQCVARPAGVLPAAALAGIVGATVIPVDRPGIGWLIAGGGITGALCLVDYRARSRGVDEVTPDGSSSDTDSEPVAASASPTPALRDRLWWAVAALALLGVGTFRAAGWLFVLCVIAACVAGSLAVLGRRSVRGIAHDMFAVPLATFGAVPWAFSGLREARPVQPTTVRKYGVSVAATAALLVVFVPLLGGADATFAGLLNGLVPTVDAAAAWQWLLLFGVVGIGALGALYVLAGPPSRATDSGRPVRLWSRSEWMLPVGALTVLFAVFLGAQFVALFGGDDYVQRTAGLTYAEYARSGFWQLSAVSILTLAVILAVLHWSAQDTAADRTSLRVMLGAVSVLALVIVCSALGRMWTYQQAYGFTVLRLLVTMCELWVGVVYVLVLIAIARLRWSWVPRAAVGTALGTLLALAVLNPEYLVAERNIDRWETSTRLDTDYLGRLSPDILPALGPLPESLRTEIEAPILHDLEPDPWWAWNLSRSSAR
ncbi:DUF4153 domain-containing protein [Nocardia sp. NPDC058640]|uniref:DUF4153 domain-containing protein n=1 Tax=Nocardia sp. NPDC058640 TaxID=3346571 RepID=UPI00364BFAF1